MKMETVNKLNDRINSANTTMRIYRDGGTSEDNSLLEQSKDLSLTWKLVKTLMKVLKDNADTFKSQGDDHTSGCRLMYASAKINKRVLIESEEAINKL